MLADGYVWHSQSESKKITMSSSSSSSIPLWETDLVWYSPIPAYSLFTTPGINYTTTGMQTCSDTQLRWAMSWVVNECRKGGTITSKSIWERYLTTLPSSYPATDPRYEFVITFTAESTFTSATDKYDNRGLHKHPAPQQHPGMPSLMSESQLTSNLETSIKDITDMRHPGPGPQADIGPSSQHSQMSQNQYSTPPRQTPAQPQPSTHKTDPVWYQKSCIKCDWQSIGSHNPAAYAGAVSDYESHKKEAHPEGREDTSEFSKYSKESFDYIEATKLRDVEACKDDGVSNLAPARFYRAPYDWKKSQLAIPLEQTPICTVGDFEPFGIIINNRRLIRDCHSRGCKSHKLRDFSDANLRTVPSHQDTVVGLERGSSGSFITKKAYKELNGIREAIKAALNYMDLMRQLHPLDSGPQILFKVRFFFLKNPHTCL